MSEVCGTAPIHGIDLGIGLPRIPGLDADSVERLMEKELSQILLPSACLKAGGTVTVNLNSDRRLNEISLRRVGQLQGFLQEVAAVAASWKRDELPVSFNALAADSHDGAKRPLLLQHPANPMVIKFADPRPYLLLAEVLRHVSGGVGVDLNMPLIKPDPGRKWYLVPYLKEIKAPLYDADRYMFSMGVLIAVAYCLGMTDLHLENVIADGGKPVIIDPECILCNFDSGSAEDRLRNTGLLSHNIHLSALRGGDTSATPLYSIDLFRCDDGIIDYRKPVAGFRNRVREVSSPGFADPVMYWEIVVSGYETAFSWLVGNKDLLCDILNKTVDDDFRIRFLFRKTRQYASILHMLNLPCLYGSEIWQQGIFDRFRSSGSFSPGPSRRALGAEWNDLLARDIPYFWINAGDVAIHHRSGVVQRWNRAVPPRRQAIRSLQNLCRDDVKRHIKVLRSFLAAGS